MGALLSLSRGIDRINRLIAQAASWLILFAVTISAINAIVRKVVNVSSNAWLESQWYLFGAAYMLAAAYTLCANEHIRIDLLYTRWPRRRQNWIDLLGHIFFLMPFAGLMVYHLYPWFMRAYRTGEMSVSASGLPFWPARLVILLGFVLLFVQGISEIIKKIAIMRGDLPDDNAPHTDPVGAVLGADTEARTNTPEHRP